MNPQNKRDIIDLFAEPVGHANLRAKNAGDILIDGGKTFLERHKVYGNNFLKVGNMMVAMFPDGLTITTPEDWVRLELLIMKVVKFSRYAENFTKGGHKDSIHDDMVYAAMLEHVDEVLRNDANKVITKEDHMSDARLAI